MFKKFLSLFGVMAVFSVMNFTVFAESFSDVDEVNPDFQAVEFLRDAGIVSGYSDGTFGDDSLINRAEFLKIVMMAKDFSLVDKDCYADVEQGEWYTPYICGATEAGLVHGYMDGSFKPAKYINFVEASKIVAKVFGEEQDGGGEVWYEGYVKFLEAKSAIPVAISGFSKYLTRGEMAEMVWRLSENITYKASNTYDGLKNGKMAVALGGEIRNFSSCDELSSYVKNNSQGGVFKGVEPLYFEADSSSSSNYSETNVQVEGVDEADIVKTDGEYIYVLSSNVLYSSLVHPVSSMRNVDSYAFGDDVTFTEMYLNDDGDRLVVIADLNPYVALSEKDSDNYSNIYGPFTKVFVFDVSNGGGLELMRTLSFDSYSLSSRMVGDVIYFVGNHFMYGEDLLPLYSDSGNGGEVRKQVNCSDVQYVPGVINEVNSVVLNALDISNDDTPVESRVIVGASKDVYVSGDNFYMAESKYPWLGGDALDVETYIHKFSLDGLKMDYKGVATVEGTVLNQFSMDEDNGYFRVVTTNHDFLGGKSFSSVYVINSDLEVVGKLTGLAEGEDVHSARFYGDKLYLVTFERVDPFFVIDLSNVKAPAVLGRLKLPGVSEYLHVIDDTHVLGFGFDTEDAEWGGVIFGGIRLALFDVSDVNHPVEVDHEVIGMKGTHSTAQYDHKAFFFDDKEGVVGFPVNLVDGDVVEGKFVDDVDKRFIGAYFYNVDFEDGFTFKGRISQYDGGFTADPYMKRLISRILYIGDYYYTVSSAGIFANWKSSLDKVAEVIFE